MVVTPAKAGAHVTELQHDGGLVEKPQGWFTKVLSRSNPSLQYATSRDWQPCVYIMASRRHGTLYIGVTSNIAMRAWQHREGILPGFTKKYGIKTLVYYEFHATMEAAILREKQMKEWHRAWKIELIESVNRPWRDLYGDLAL